MNITRIDGKQTSGSETIIGTDRDEWIYPLGGSDTIDGRGGFDTVVVAWASTNFKIATYPGITYLDTISGASSADKVTLLNVESVQFNDQTVNLFEDTGFTNHPGGEVFQGGWGLDSVSYEGERKNYAVSLDTSGADVRDIAGTTGTDRLLGIERIHFKDVSLALDLAGRAGTVLKILGAVFGPQAIHNQAYAGIGLYHLDQLGMDSDQLMTLALHARLGAQIGNFEEVVKLLYTNVVGTSPDAKAILPFVALLESGQHTVLSLAQMAAETDLNLEHVGLIGAVAAPLEYV